MTLNLKILEEFQKDLIEKKDFFCKEDKEILKKVKGFDYDGVRYIFKINNFTVSVIKSIYTYGGFDDLWELALLDEKGVYYCEFTNNDVLGYLTDKDVNIALYCIKNNLLDVSFDEIKKIIEIGEKFDNNSNENVD